MTSLQQLQTDANAAQLRHAQPECEEQHRKRQEDDDHLYLDTEYGDLREHSGAQRLYPACHGFQQSASPDLPRDTPRG